MKKVRIIARLDIKGPSVVKGIHAEGLRVVGSPKELAKKYYEDGADEIIYTDIVASLYQRNLDFDLLKSVSEDIFIPLTVGGGIRSIHDINNALRAGADKVAINTYGINNPKFLKDAVEKFGSQSIVVSIEAKKIAENKWEAYTDGGREKTNTDAIEWAKQTLDLGIGEILITSIDKDGTKSGYEMELINSITSFTPVPVIAHGGAKDMGSFAEIIQKTDVDAVSASSVFHYENFSISSLKKYLSENNINASR